MITAENLYAFLNPGYVDEKYSEQVRYSKLPHAGTMHWFDFVSEVGALLIAKKPDLDFLANVDKMCGLSEWNNRPAEQKDQPRPEGFPETDDNLNKIVELFLALHYGDEFGSLKALQPLITYCEKLDIDLDKIVEHQPSRDDYELIGEIKDGKVIPVSAEKEPSR